MGKRDEYLALFDLDWVKRKLVMRNNLPFQFPMSSSLSFFSPDSFCTRSHSAAHGMPGRYCVWCFLPPRKYHLYSCDARICSCCFGWILCSSSVQLRKVSHVSGAAKEVLVRLFTSKCSWWLPGLHTYIALSHG